MTKPADHEPLVEAELQVRAQAEAAEIGRSHGWDSANYAEAYGQTKTETWGQEAARRAGQRYPDGYPVRFVGAVRQEYREAFVEGVTLFESGKYPDGTPMEED